MVMLTPTLVSCLSCHIQGFHTAADGTFPTAAHIISEILDAYPFKIIRAFYLKTFRTLRYIVNMACKPNHVF